MPKSSASNPYGWFTDEELEAFERSGLTKPADRERAREHLRHIRRDPIYTEQLDPEFNRYLKSAYETTLDGAKPQEEGIERRDPLPNKPVPPWRPAAKAIHLQLSAPVGSGLANDKWDVVNAKKLLAAAGHYRFDLTRERAHEMGEQFEDAIRRFQKDANVPQTGAILPDDDTIGALRQKLFPDHHRRHQAFRAELREREAAKAEQAKPEKQPAPPTPDGDETEKQMPELPRAQTEPADQPGVRKAVLMPGDRADMRTAPFDPARDRARVRLAKAPGEEDDLDAANDDNSIRRERRQDDDANRAPSRQQAQSDPVTQPPAHVGDVRKKDEEDLARLGHGPGVWVADEDDEFASRLTLRHPDTLAPVRDRQGNPIRIDRNDEESARQNQEPFPNLAGRVFTMDELKRIRLSKEQLDAIGGKLRKLENPIGSAATMRLRSDAEGDGKHHAPRRHGPHDGLDILVKPGEPVIAPISGEIVEIRVPYPNPSLSEFGNRTYDQLNDDEKMEWDRKNAGDAHLRRSLLRVRANTKGCLSCCNTLRSIRAGSRTSA